MAEMGIERGCPRGVLDILPKELWQEIATKIEDPQDWLNFIRVSPVLEVFMGSQKSSKLLPEVLKLVFVGKFYVDAAENDLLSFRLINRAWKDVIDNSLIVQQKGGQVREEPEAGIILDSISKVSQFASDMSAEGPVIPCQISLTLKTNNVNEHFGDRVSVRAYWTAVARLAEKIGRRIASVYLDICVDFDFGDEFSAHVVKIVMYALRRMPNLQVLLIDTSTIAVEKAMETYYPPRQQSKEGRDCLDHGTIVFTKLRTFQLVIGQSRDAVDKPTCLLPRFLEYHAGSIKNLNIYVSLHQIGDLSRQILQVEKLEHFYLDIHYCCFNDYSLDLDALAAMPVVHSTDVGEPLKKIQVNIDWEWRSRDLTTFLKWLSNNYSDYSIDRIVLSSYQPSFVTSEYPSNRNEFSWLMKNPSPRFPSVKSLVLISLYRGSWAFLEAFQNTINQVEILCECPDPAAAYKSGFLKGMYGNQRQTSKDVVTQNTMIWDYFPKLQTLVIMHPTIFGLWQRNFYRCIYKAIEESEKMILEKMQEEFAKLQMGCGTNSGKKKLRKGRKAGKGGKKR